MYVRVTKQNIALWRMGIKCLQLDHVHDAIPWLGHVFWEVGGELVVHLHDHVRKD